MKKRLGILGISAVLMITFIPAFGIGTQAQNNGRRFRQSTWERRDNQNNNDQGRRRRMSRTHLTYGYRNYGQYRRTQVGNRRFRPLVTDRNRFDRRRRHNRRDQ